MVMCIISAVTCTVLLGFGISGAIYANSFIGEFKRQYEAIRNRAVERRYYSNPYYSSSPYYNPFIYYKCTTNGYFNYNTDNYRDFINCMQAQVQWALSESSAGIAYIRLTVLNYFFLESL